MFNGVYVRPADAHSFRIRHWNSQSNIEDMYLPEGFFFFKWSKKQYLGTIYLGEANPVCPFIFSSESIQCIEYLGVKIRAWKNWKLVKSGYFDSVSSYGESPQLKGLNSKFGVNSAMGGRPRLPGLQWWAPQGSARGHKPLCWGNALGLTAWPFSGSSDKASRGWDAT